MKFGVFFVFALTSVASRPSKVFNLTFRIRESNKKCCMIWPYSCSFCFDVKANRPEIFIKCSEAALQKLPKDCQKKFRKDGNVHIFATDFNYLYQAIEPDAKEEKVYPQSRQLHGFGDPREISVDTLAEFFRTKRVIIYTGAGLSASVVPVESELHKLLRLPVQGQESTNKENFDYVIGLIRNPQECIHALQTFFDKLLNTDPTPAHVALAKIINTYGSGLVTENIDELHQKTGLNPPRFAGMARYLNNSTLQEEVKNADVLFIVGLSADQSGFLMFCTSVNPHIQMVALNTERPQYLGEDDFFLQGDCQDLIPQLWELLSAQDQPAQPQPTDK